MTVSAKWMDSGGWDPVNSPELVRVLAATFSSRQEIQRLLDDAGISRGRMLDSGTGHEHWHHLVFDLCRTGELRRLLTVVNAESVALAPVIAALDTEVLAAPHPDHGVSAMPGAPPVRVGVIPPLADCFQDRSELEAVRELDSGGTAVLTQVLSGLGGVGKSQVAAAFARSQAARVDVLVWITAASREAIVGGYATAAAELGCPTVEGLQQAADWFLAWLQRTGRTWLVVLDDLQDPADMVGLWPDGSGGRTLVTTRRTDSALSRGGRRRIDVGLFTPRQACQYLADKLQSDIGTARMQEADELAADLGFLPLALAQAAAFITDRGESCAGYRRRLDDRRRRLPEVFPPDALADNYTATVAATWSMSIEIADLLPPVGLARPLLELASMFDPNGFPATLIDTPEVAAYLNTHVDGGTGARPVDAMACRDALHNVARLSLLTLTNGDSDAGRVRVHALVQRATIEHLSAERLRDLARAAADALLDTWPKIELDPAFGQLLRANAAALISRAGDLLWQPEWHPILSRAGRSLDDSGLLDAARTHWADMVATSHRLLGPDHPDTLTARHHLAHLRGQAGDPAHATAAFEELLADELRTLGPDHPHTLATRHNLAYWRQKGGDPSGAAAAFAQLLPDRERVLGPDHLDTLSTRYQLARCRGKAGDPAAAATDTEQLLADRLRVLGPDHRDTLTTRHSLARWRGEAGDPAGAADAFAEVLIDRLRVLGADHKNTLATRSQLARWRGEAGDPAGAADAFAQLFADYRRILGPDHPHTLATRHNLARWLGESGDPVGAVTACEQVLTDELRVLGADHPHTLATRHELGRWRGVAGDPQEAVATLTQLLTDRVRVLGPEHRHTRETRDELAGWQRAAARPDRAIGSTS